jgi:hypothetical protein
VGDGSLRNEAATWSRVASFTVVDPKPGSVSMLAGRASLAACVFLLLATWASGALKCPADSAKVGNVCIDLYEASVWQIDPANTKLVKLVQGARPTSPT